MSIIKGKILRPDQQLYDGKSLTATRKSSNGGTVSGLKINNRVDVLQVYGSGNSFTGQTIQNAINAVGSNSVSFEFAPGTWIISANVTVPSNVTCIVPAGVVFSPAASVTLTFNGPVIREAQTWTGGSGTVTVSSTWYHSSSFDITGDLDVSGYISTTHPVSSTAGGGAAGVDYTVADWPTLVSGRTYSFRAHTANTAAANIDSVNIVSVAGVAITAGQIIADGVYYVRYDGTNLELLNPEIQFSTQAEQEAATSTDTAINPSVQQYHPSAVKGWAEFSYSGGTPTADVSYNVTSITDGGAGNIVVNWDGDFSGTSYVYLATAQRPAATDYVVTVTSLAAGSTTFQLVDLSGTETDIGFSVAVLGDRA